MSFWDRLRRKQTLVEPVEPILTSDKVIINDDKVIINPENDKTDLILNKLEGLNLALKVHDNRLIEHDLKTDEHYTKLAGDLTSILVDNKLIPEEKRQEVNDLIATGLRDKKPRQDVIKDLVANGIPQSTAYRYTKHYSLV